MAGFTWKRLAWGIGTLVCLLLSATSFSSLAQLDGSALANQAHFWPTQTKYPRNLYAGAESCAACHKEIFDDAKQTSMARTAMLAGDSRILRSNPSLTFNHASYHYEIRTSGGKTTYAITNRTQQESAALVWTFGTDRVAQSWLFKENNGQFYEVRVTYFRGLNGLGFTPGRGLDHPADIREAMYRPVGRAEVYTCFGCHTTASGFESSFDDRKLIPGVSCEACHGPGRAHIDLMEDLPPGHIANGPVANTHDAIFSPKKLTPAESVDFCGACHGSFLDISLSGGMGVDNVKFQPFRLEESKCWNPKDPRLTCIACHDPHKQVDPVASDYDHVCLSCHINRPLHGRLVLAKLDQSHPGKACPIARRNCTSCHMPETYVPAMHRAFPDHRIRIARAGEPFPD